MDDSVYDIAIVGGGMVGISLAIALGRMTPAPRVVLIEAQDYAKSLPPSFDARTIALSYSSRQIFEGLTLWPALQTQGVTPIKTIHISDRGHAGITHLQASEQQVDALGYVVENRLLGQVLYQGLQALAHVQVLTPAELRSMSLGSRYAELHGEHKGQPFALRTKLVVAADGTHSFVRQHLGVEQRHWDYRQSAVIANIACDRPHHNIAYERFTSNGPMALLPLNGMDDTPHRYGLVWTVPTAQVEAVMSLSDDEVAIKLREYLGSRVGNFIRIGQRHAYALGHTQIREHVRHRLAFIGNAAHILHPVAGQGFNLGLRDVAALAQVIQAAMSSNQDPGDLSCLQAYAQWRRRDLIQTSLFTDSLVRVFSTDFPPLVVARNLGLFAMECFAPLRKRLTRHAMGYVGRASLLARGLGL
ncbi:MAG: 2-octaprenyl-6-methoxyphenyl hydroxylase [Gammaproteobacteria bacterium]|nr:2-octaprenyl-6-methoxyphenyl hydroxylase [Gammaproteobacteria bacterium]